MKNEIESADFVVQAGKSQQHASVGDLDQLYSSKNDNMNDLEAQIFGEAEKPNELVDELGALEAVEIKNENEAPMVAMENQQENQSEGEQKDDKYETNDKLRQDGLKEGPAEDENKAHRENCSL